MIRRAHREKLCAVCGKPFRSHRPEAMTCGETCKKRRQRGSKGTGFGGFGPPLKSLVVPPTAAAMGLTEAERILKLYPNGKEVFCDLVTRNAPGRVDWIWGHNHLDVQPGINMIPVNLGFEWRWLYPTKSGGWCVKRKCDSF